MTEHNNSEVWVLTINEPHEGGSVYGAFSSREAAESAERDLDYYRGFEFVKIERIVIDAAPAYRSGFDDDDVIYIHEKRRH